MLALIYPSGVVANLVEEADLELPDGWQLVAAADGVQPGWSYVAGVFYPPAAAPAAQRMLPIAQFMLRIPFPKLVAIQAASATDPSIQVILKVIDLLTNIDLDDPQTSALLDVLIAGGHLTADDKAAVLA